MATAPPPPEQRASEIINKLPSSPNLITKTGTALLGTGLTAAAISQELYVVNEETIILVGSVILVSYLAKVCWTEYCSSVTEIHCSRCRAPTSSGQRQTSSVSRTFSTSRVLSTPRPFRIALATWPK